MQTKLLTISKIRQEYDIPRDSIDKAIRERKLNAYKLQGRTLYIKREELENWIESRLSNVPLLRSKHIEFLNQQKSAV